MPAKKKGKTVEPKRRRAPKEGAKAPDFELPADDGSSVRLKDLRGTSGRKLDGILRTTHAGEILAAL